MEEQVKKIEEILGAKFEDWNQDTLAGILSSEEALKSFTPELVVHLLLTRKNDNVVDTLVPIKYGFDIRAAKAKIEEQLIALKEKKLPMEDYKKAVLEIGQLDNPIFKTAVYLTAVASFGKDYDVSADEKGVREAISGIKKILLSLKMDEGFQIMTEILDLLFPLRELYFQRYNVDLFKDDKELEDLISRVNERAKEIVEFIKNVEKENEASKKKEE
jgi:hypothetical protein